MYNQNIKVKYNRSIVDAILKKLKIRNLEEYINLKLSQELNK
jgi:hypothetical protein